MQLINLPLSSKVLFGMTANSSGRCQTGSFLSKDGRSVPNENARVGLAPFFRCLVDLSLRKIENAFVAFYQLKSWNRRVCILVGLGILTRWAVETARAAVKMTFLQRWEENMEKASSSNQQHHHRKKGTLTIIWNYSYMTKTKAVCSVKIVLLYKLHENFSYSRLETLR